MTILDDWKVLPRLMMLAVTVLTQSGLVSVCMGALTGCFGIWMGKESKTSVAPTKVVHEEKYSK